MAWRSNEAPMEFEYDNGVGDLDRSENRSPFARLAKAGTLDRNFGSAFKSPQPVTKPSFNMPALPETPKSQMPTFREHVNTDFSSAAESSPDAGNGADNEDTPEMKRIENVTIFRGSSPHKTKSPPIKRQSWLQRLKSRPHTELIRKAHKRKRREVEREDRSIAIHRGGDDPYNDDDSSRPSSSDSRSQPFSRKKAAKESGTIASILTFIHDHPKLPTIIAFYGQCLFSLFILSLFGWMIWSMYGAIMRQIEHQAEILGEDARRNMEKCESDWHKNRCFLADIPPALEEPCSAMDRCRRQDWRAKGMAKIGAKTFAEILNSFVDPLSYKLILVGLALVALLIASPFAVLTPLRRATESHLQHEQAPPPPPPHPSHHYYHPQTPSRQMQAEWANAGGMATGFFTPQTGRQWDQNTWGSPSKRLEGKSRSPVKQLDFRQYS